MIEEQRSPEFVVSGAEESSSAKKQSPRWLLWAGLGVLVVVIVAAAFVGGRLLARQHLVNPAGIISVEMSMPDILPQEPPAATGTVGRVEGKVITVDALQAGSGGGVMIVSAGDSGQTLEQQGQQGETKKTEVVTTNETRFYKLIQPGMDELQGGGVFQMKAEEGTLADVQSGQMVQVWGDKSGDRVTADVVCITGLSIGP